MATVRLQIDVSGTVGDEAWRGIAHFGEILEARFGAEHGSSGRCAHPPGVPHGKGEWIGAIIRVQTSLVAHYAMSHYLQQERVLDADIED